MSHQHIYEPINGRVFIVGDVHGAKSKLMEALAAVGFDFERDRLVCCGDLIDRGNESIEMIKLIQEPWFSAVKGNHDKFAVTVFDSILSDDSKRSAELMSAWFEVSNGGAWFAQETYENKEFCLTRGRDLLESLPSAITISFASGLRVGVVHADPLKSSWVPGFYENIGSSTEWLAMTSRAPSEQDETVVRGIDAVCVGHSIISSTPKAKGNLIFCDTGGWAKGRKFTLINEEYIEAILTKNSTSTMRADNQLSASLSRRVTR